MAMATGLRASMPNKVAWGRPDGAFRPEPTAVATDIVVALVDAVSESGGRSRRSYRRLSRRAESTDLQRPGVLGETGRLTVLLDTSGSMLPYFQQALGLLVAVAHNLSATEVRIVQVDGTVQRDDVLGVHELEEVHVMGSTRPELFLPDYLCPKCGHSHAWILGDAPPTDLRAGMEAILGSADEVVVFSDGLIIIDPVPELEVVWALFGGGFGFIPTHGRVTHVAQPEAH